MKKNTGATSLIKHFQKEGVNSGELSRSKIECLSPDLTLNK